MEVSHSTSEAPVASSSPRRQPVRVAVMAALMATLTLGCFGMYPGMARTTVHYYNSNGQITATVVHETSWRQASIAMPSPIQLPPAPPPVAAPNPIATRLPLPVAHSEEYALALVDLYKQTLISEDERREAILTGADEPAVSAAEAADPATAAIRAGMLWIDHKPISGDGGMAGAWGALLGLLSGLLVGVL